MKLHILTVGEPKLEYAKLGWQEYTGRLRRYHDLRLTHLDDKYANNLARFEQAIGRDAFRVALTANSPQMDSHELAAFLSKRALDGYSTCFMIGGPDGLPPEIITSGHSSLDLGLSRLTLPHDLAMVVLAEALYRASTIQAGHPYHR